MFASSLIRGILCVQLSILLLLFLPVFPSQVLARLERHECVKWGKIISIFVPMSFLLSYYLEIQYSHTLLESEALLHDLHGRNLVVREVCCPLYVRLSNAYTAETYF